MSNKVKMYVAVKRDYEERNGILTLALKQVGFVGGGIQIFTGGSVCLGSFGLACASFGTPLITHGSNNIYENGYYLLFRTDTTGYVRDAYRYVAKQLGYGIKSGDIAFSTVDLALSGYGMVRSVAHPDARRLYYYMDNEFIMSWREMGRVGLGLEAVSDTISLYTIYKLKDDFK